MANTTAHLQNSKTSRDSDVDQELSIFIKIFEFNLVTQPFKWIIMIMLLTSSFI
jgi:hypothetical protein